MPLFPDLSHRHRQAELMDAPDLDPVAHHKALVGLGRINRWSRSSEILWPVIYRRAQLCSKAGPLRVLDVASGGGDVPLRLAQKAVRAGVALEMVGLDMSPVAVEYARKAARLAGIPMLFEVHDVLRDPLPGGFDVVTSSLFLHHLDPPDATRLLRSMAGAGRLVVVNDLRRSWPGYLLAHVACRILTSSPVVHIDGPRSVAGAFSTDEIARLCATAGLAPVQIKRRWPGRFLLTYESAVQ